MANESQKTYQRLPGSGHRQIVPGWAIVLLLFVIGIFALLLRGRRVQLWLGEDHLLSVEWDGAREYYKRFRYEDIQAVTIRRTIEGKLANVGLGLIVAGFAAMAFAVNDQVGLIILLSVAGLFGLALLVNFLQGPTCQCHLSTAVQTEKLPSLGRLRSARKALDRLRARIAAVQGELPPAEIPARMQELLASGAGTQNLNDPNSPPVISARSKLPGVAAPRHYHGGAHFVLFCLLVADLPVTSLDLLFHSMAMQVLNMILFVVTLAFTIAALVRQHNTDLPRILKKLPWITLGCISVFFVVGVVYGIALAINNPAVARQNPSPLDDPILLVMTTVSTSTTIVLGVIGFFQLRKFRLAAHAQSLPPTVNQPVA